MRKQLNKFLVKFGLLLTKAPSLLADKALPSSDLLPAELTEKVKVGEAKDTPDNKLFQIFSADTNVHKWHHYFEIYSKHFEPYRSRPVKMLEIGVYRGGSLRMWKKYFHPKSTIVGIDIDKSCQEHEIANQKVHVRIGSQADPDFLNKVNEEFGPFDIILDDGSHKTHHQITSFGALFRPALKEGGCYMVEDLHTNYWIMYTDSPESFIELSKQMIDMLHEPYLGRREVDFRLGHSDAVQEIELSYLSAHLDAINFHDSIVALTKRKRALPISELR